LPGFMRKLNADSLLKNSAFLLGNLLLTSVCGFGSLTLLTHFFSVTAVGISATAISACVLVESVTQFGLSYSLPRFLPTAKNRAALINTALTTVLLSTLLLSVVMLALPYAKGFFVLGGWLFGVLFVLAACVLGVETILSTVLVADRASDKMAKASVVPNLLKLAAPPVLVVLGTLGSFVSRVTSDFLSTTIFAILVARRGHRFRLQLDFTGTRDIVRFSGGMYLASIVGGLPTLLLPLIVFSRVGAKNAAYWGIAMSVATLLFQLPSMISQALLPEATHQAAERRRLIRRSALLVTAVVLPALVIVFLFATTGLAVFGRPYVAGAAGALRWLVIAALITMLNSMAGAILVLAKKSFTITVVNIVNAIVILGMVLLWAKNVNEIAISWVAGDVCNTVLFFFSAFLALREVEWRWEDLGGLQVESAVGPVPLRHAPTGGLQGLALLIDIAERQQQVRNYLPSRYPLTDSRGLFTVMAFEAAERERAERLGKATSARDQVQPAPKAQRQPSPSGPRHEQAGPRHEPADPEHEPADPEHEQADPQHEQAFHVLFQMAERQRKAGLLDPRHRRPRGGQNPYGEE
jgi:O-antigen/teichoic acid export membrane protein